MTEPEKIQALEKEIADFRAIDRYKDKDWEKWYGLYHAKVDEVKELQSKLDRVEAWAAELRIGERVNYRKRYEELIQNYPDGMSGEQQFEEHLKEDSARENAFRDEINELRQAEKWATEEGIKLREELTHMTAMRENVEKENWERFEKMKEQSSLLSELAGAVQSLLKPGWRERKGWNQEDLTNAAFEGLEEALTKFNHWKERQK